MGGIYGGLGKGDARLEATVIIQVDRGVSSRCLERKESEDTSKKELIRFRFCL